MTKSAEGIMTLEIFIDYKLYDSSDWHTIIMSAEEYFDASLLEPDENFNWNSIPEYDHAIDYLDIDRALVSNTRIKIDDKIEQISLVISTSFWHQGQNFVIERVKKDSKQKLFYTTIVNTKLQENPSVWEILRFVRKEEELSIEFHSFIRDNEDGSQTEIKVFPID